MNTPASILVVDDEPDLLDNIVLALETENYGLLTANDGREALEILQSQPVDLILADVAMPDMNGYQLYGRVRKNPAWAIIPFIFLTARTMDSDIRYGKELGVDDYLTKPIRSADLLAAVRGKLNRAQQLSEAVTHLTPSPERKTDTLTIEPLRIDPTQHRVWLNEQELKLSAKEFTLLEHLARQAGSVVSPEALIQVTHQFKTDHIEAGQLLRPLILSLRRKLGLSEGEIGSIENVRGVGYRLVIPDE
jgi:DNA-binding response OmpR family regulator